MLELYFLRHAKSDWDSFDGNDFNRNISENGVIETKKIGEFLVNEEIIFDEILCSPSLRTKRLGRIHYRNSFLDNCYHFSFDRTSNA